MKYMRISNGARQLLDVLNWFRKKGKEAYASVAWYAARLECCARTIKRRLAELRKSGLIEINYHGRNGAVMGVSNRGQNVPDCVPDCVPESAPPLITEYRSSTGRRYRAAFIERKPPERASENFVLPHMRAAMEEYLRVRKERYG